MGDGDGSGDAALASEAGGAADVRQGRGPGQLATGRARRGVQPDRRGAEQQRGREAQQCQCQAATM